MVDYLGFSLYKIMSSANIVLLPFQSRCLSHPFFKGLHTIHPIYSVLKANPPRGKAVFFSFLKFGHFELAYVHEGLHIISCITEYTCYFFCNKREA